VDGVLAGRRGTPRADGSLLVVLWCTLTFLFYSVAGTKVPNYILPIYPFAAIGVAAMWDAALATGGADRRLGTSIALLVVLLGALVGGVARYFAGLYPGAGATFAQLAYYDAIERATVIPAAALGIGLAAAAVLMLARATLPAFVVLCLTMAATWLGVLTWIAPVIDAQRSIRPLALAIRAELRPGDRIVGYRLGYASLVYYTDHHVDWISRPAALPAAVCAPGRAFIVIDGQSLAELQETVPAGLVPVAKRNGIDVLLKPASVRCMPGRIPAVPPRPRQRAQPSGVP